MDNVRHPVYDYLHYIVKQVDILTSKNQVPQILYHIATWPAIIIIYSVVILYG